MAKQGKRLKEISSNLEEGRVYDPSEAVELANRYSDEQGRRMINGVFRRLLNSTILSFV